MYLLIRIAADEGAFDRCLSCKSLRQSPDPARGLFLHSRFRNETQNIEKVTCHSTMMSLITVQVRLFPQKNNPPYTLLLETCFSDFGTFLTCMLILFGKFVILYGYLRLYGYWRYQSSKLDYSSTLESLTLVGV